MGRGLTRLTGEVMVAPSVRSSRSLIGTVGIRLFSVFAIAVWIMSSGQPAWAQSSGPQNWELRTHSQQMAVPTGPATSQSAPHEIPRFDISRDPAGKLATFQPAGPTDTSSNAYFQVLGTNGRSCFTCHRGNHGWTVSAASVRQRFAKSNGTDPIFRLVDGATCSTDDVSSLSAMKQAYSLL